MAKQPEGTLPVPITKTTMGKPEGSLLTRMSKLMKEHQNIMYCRRGMVGIFFPNIDEERNPAAWSRAYWDIAAMFNIMLEDSQVSVKKVGATQYYHWAG
jgi:hypothetical protein